MHLTDAPRDHGRVVRIALWPIGAGAGVAAGIALLGAGDFSSPAGIAFALLIGWSFIGSGLVA